MRPPKTEWKLVIDLLRELVLGSKQMPVDRKSHWLRELDDLEHSEAVEKD